MNVAKTQEFGIQYTGFWDGNAVVKGIVSTTDAAVADGVISLDEMTTWKFTWTGNSQVAGFTIAANNGTAAALTPPGGFLVRRSNTPLDAQFQDADGVDQGIYQSAASDQLIDLGALLIEDFAAGTTATGNATKGRISVSPIVEFAVSYKGFWANDGGGAIQGILSASEADAADGVISLDEIVSWRWNWKGNDVVAPFTLTSQDGIVNTLMPPGGFKLGGGNTPVNLNLIDVDGLDQGLFESAAGDRVLDLGALIVENFTTGTTTIGDASANGTIDVSRVLTFSTEFSGYWKQDGGGAIKGQFSASEADAADGVITIDELINWNWQWTGNRQVGSFSVSSEAGNAIALLPANGFRVSGNQVLPVDFNDANKLDLGLYESSDGNRLIDIGALLIENLGTGKLSQGIVPPPVKPAELVGFAALPADTFAAGPNAGAGITGNGRTGPFAGQPVQGFSGVQFAPGGKGDNYWFLSDNGFGAKNNSADYLLRLYQVDPSFAGSEQGDRSVAIQGFVQLRDPDRRIPFAIQNENTTDRHLTGADFDVESFVIDAKGDIWIGEEFGPYLLHFDATGKLLEAPIATPNITSFKTLSGDAPIVIGHRGASGSRPEHTLEAYKLAIEQGANFIEPDLVVTKDGVLVARHENEISGTSDVASRPEFADRKTTKTIDGDTYTGWFVEDFTLAELKTLRAKERIPATRPGNTAFDGQFEIPTLKEIIDLVKQVEAQTGKKIGIYPETKHPTFLAKEGKFLDGTLINLDTSQLLVDTLIAEGFTDPSRIFIQSFEFQNLIEIQQRLNQEGLGNIPLVQLYGDTTRAADPQDSFSFPYDIRYNVSQGKDLKAIYGQAFLDAAEKPLSANTVYADLDSPAMLQVMRELYAEGAGPWKNNILLREPLTAKVDGNGDGKAEIGSQLTGEITSFIDDAHAAGLQVHPYTLRNEENFLTLNPDGTPQTPEQELVQLTQIGADGFFTDFPGTGAKVIKQVAADFVYSPDHPRVLAGDLAANLGRSRGYEGMAFSLDRKTLYPLLEGTVLGDPEGSLRIYQFDTTSSSFQGLAGLYQMESPSHAIGDFTPINATEFLVIERDNNQGAAAAFKKIFKIDLSKTDANGFVQKTEVVDLLNIADPQDLNGDGSLKFSFPFVTIENILVLDKDTILVANDNNYPFSIGRDFSGKAIDNNEIIQIKLGESLNLDASLGKAALQQPTPEPDSTVKPQVIYGRDFAETLKGGLGNDTIYGNGGMDTLIGEAGDDYLYGSDAAETIFGGRGNDVIYANGGMDYIDSGSGNDQVWLGGTSHATVKLNSGEGFVTIVNYQAGATRLQVNSLNGLTFADSRDGLQISQGSDLLAVIAYQTQSSFNRNSLFAG
ncbi:esterase-like activity of phytase family protein [Alkalinema sp. FACHB-956]|uniref:esterase-like activity of phytase family protein n=1 Tax=Alkalinema sp. FACHB-956 TaxID=2692768 RepID=UPI001F54ECAB|nr:esterase-like activity of phytase family protein [Alkalinema sp. FACHB-956]